MMPGITASGRVMVEHTLTLTNPDAEINSGVTSTAVPTGWTLISGQPRIRVEPSREPPQGAAIFDGGAQALSRCFQRIDLQAQGVPLAAIDAGEATLVADWWGGTFNQTPLDVPRLDYVWRDGSLTEITTQTNGNRSPSTVIGQMRWNAYHDEFTVPAGARFLDVTMVFTRFAGTNNDAAIDDIRLAIRAPI